MKRFFLLLCCLTVLTGCAAPAANLEPAQAQFFSMDTLMSIRVYNEGGEDALQAARQEIEKLDKLLSRTDPDSQISLLNSHAGDGTLVPLDAQVTDLLSFAKSVSQLVPGCFDITIAPVMDAWGFTTEERHVPTAEALTAAMALVDSGKLIVDEAASAARLEQAGMEVDLGAVAKGFAAGRADAVLREEGVTSALLQLGGSVTAVGSNPDGSPWRVAVTDPSDPSAVLGVLLLEDTSAVTSGGYQRYFTQNGVTYHHIIDPETGYPADSGLLSVTVVCSNATLADLLSTAAFVLGEEDALDLWRAEGGFELLLVTEDGRIVATSGLEDLFSLELNLDAPLEIVR